MQGEKRYVKVDEYKIEYGPNWEYAIRNGLLTDRDLHKIRTADYEERDKLENIVITDTFGRRVNIKFLKRADNVGAIYHNLIFNNEGDYEVSIDLEVESGSTIVPIECKFRGFSWTRTFGGDDHTTLITADKWDEIVKEGGFLGYCHTDAWHLFDARKVEPVDEVWASVKKTTMDKYSNEKVRRRNYKLRYEDAFLYYTK